MVIDRVTFTGADDSVSAEDLLTISRDYPFVEWGILFSQSNQGRPRYPSWAWLEVALPALEAKVQLSAHLCGQWVRDLVINGDLSWFRQTIKPGVFRAAVPRYFGRVQINFHAVAHQVHPRCRDFIARYDRPVILQCDGINDDAVRDLVAAGNAVPLFDTSGGAGMLPRWPWPTAWPGVYCGYAGGLGPETIVAQLKAIDASVPADAKIWIDMERRVRSEDDQMFDLGKVRAVLEAMYPGR